MEFKLCLLVVACLVAIVCEVYGSRGNMKRQKMRKRISRLQDDMEALKSKMPDDFSKFVEDKIENMKEKPTEKGWYRARNGYEYWISDRQIGTFAKAEKICGAMGARLATVGMREPAWRKEIIDNVVRPVGTWTWLGISRRDRELSKGFVWIDGVLSTSINTAWNVANDEPNNSGGNEKCGQLNHDADYLINDKDCAANCAALCERVAK